MNTAIAVSIIMVVLAMSLQTVIRTPVAATSLRCVDPTGNNLFCLLQISTATPPHHTLTCNDASNNHFKCLFVTVQKTEKHVFNKIVILTVFVNPQEKTAPSGHSSATNNQTASKAIIDCHSPNYNGTCPRIPIDNSNNGGGNQTRQ